MVKKIIKYAKFMICIIFMVSLIAPSYAALSASDGSAFVTKAEFDSALADFNARLTTFEAGINSKIDSQVSSYLDRNGIWNGKEQTQSAPRFSESSSFQTLMTQFIGTYGDASIELMNKVVVPRINKSGLLCLGVKTDKVFSPNQYLDYGTTAVSGLNSYNCFLRAFVQGDGLNTPNDQLFRVSGSIDLRFDIVNGGGRREAVVQNLSRAAFSLINLTLNRDNAGIQLPWITSSFFLFIFVAKEDELWMRVTSSLNGYYAGATPCGPSIVICPNTQGYIGVAVTSVVY